MYAYCPEAGFPTGQLQRGGGRLSAVDLPRQHPKLQANGDGQDTGNSQDAVDLPATLDAEAEEEE